MHLSFAGSPEAMAPRTLVWEKLMDPAFMAAATPGVEAVEQVDPTHYRVISGFGVGALRLQFTLDVEASNLVPPERATLTARGAAAGSTVNLAASIRLEEPAPGRTTMHWTCDCDIDGPLTGLGGLVEGAARKVVERFWLDFAQRVRT